MESSVYENITFISSGTEGEQINKYHDSARVVKYCTGVISSPIFRNVQDVGGGGGDRRAGRIHRSLVGM